MTIGIYGYGNLARGVEQAILANPDQELAVVFTRRDPAALQIAAPGAVVASAQDVLAWKGKLDVLVICGGSEVKLTAKEFDILELLVTNPGKVFTREELLKIIWGDTHLGDVRTVDVHVRRLREKIETNPSDPRYVYTKWGSGYFYKEH